MPAFQSALKTNYESSEANRGRKGGARERALEGKGVCGKTVEVFLRDFNQPAAAAPFALAKGEGTKRGRQAMPVSLFC